ncbi:mannosyl-oligosaccharide glucosidase GCS1-like [Lycium barbarum]|uniref:mannosyl-oligosaccharide glucosidase GCS1-like n=1 Tax=Lycium barbarum TaxID=112863 RepID=UPI00293E491C|nr:mannosyl-oligosaccharide glucosidase GCS1-like [Lycium barbarum]
MAGSSRGSTRSRAASKSSTTQVPNPTRKDKTRNTNTLIRVFSVNLKFLLGFAVVAFVIATFSIYQVVNNHMEKPQKLRVITPLPAPKLMDLPMFQGEHRESLYWGTYRPQVYFGVRARTPQSLVAGLMWIGVKDGRYFMRHVCQDSDELKQYGWTSHNGRDYGHQVLIEQTMSLTTSFLKSKDRGSGYGGDWAVRIGVQSNESVPDEEMLNTAHLFFYVADEGGKSLSLGSRVFDIHGDSILASGSRTEIGDWQLHLLSEDVSAIHYSGFKTPHIHNLSDLVQADLAVQARKSGHLLLSDSSDDSPNILVFQISARIPFKADIVFLSGTSTRDSRIEERASRLTGTSLTSLLSEKQKEFDNKFKKCFSLSEELGLEPVTVGKAALGNMLGGIGYFFGQSKISLPSTSTLNAGDNSVLYWPAELYTAVPSRPFFPRGFLWDEGFHQLLIWRWDIYISLDIIGHWLDLMNIDGWIPRELILGAEALSKVPEEFVLQHPTNGNPPTLFLALRDLISKLKKEKFAAAEARDISVFLDRAFVRLEAWFKWFNTTQAGKEPGSYYWHGRDAATIRELNPKTLSSGLDDYPRASHPSEDERHVDLRCWMHLAADSMHSIAELLKMDKDIQKEYGLTAKLLSDFELLNQMHLDTKNGAYCDYGNHTEKVQLTWKIVETGSNYPRRELVREVLEKPVLQLVPHHGYVSLFPFILRLIPPGSSILESQLDLISNRSILWTDFGLRSLSKTSSMYMKRNTEHDAPYWRGPIWIPLNYLIVSSLHHYSQEPGPYREKAKTVYNELRSNLIRNIVGNYKRTGYLWEQYDQQKKGKGKGARLFTGWTATVLLIMAEAYHEV